LLKGKVIPWNTGDKLPDEDSFGKENLWKGNKERNLEGGFVEKKYLESSVNLVATVS
jgi:hypothetical protein